MSALDNPCVDRAEMLRSYADELKGKIEEALDRPQVWQRKERSFPLNYLCMGYIFTNIHIDVTVFSREELKSIAIMVMCRDFYDQNLKMDVKNSFLMNGTPVFKICKYDRRIYTEHSGPY